jgi:type IV secretory pathway TrbD component
MSIQWGRVVLAAFLMELVLFAIAIPLFLSGAGRVLVYVVPPAALIATFAVTVWLGRKINSNFVLHGVLIGIVGTLMYVGLTRAQPEPWQYWAAHALKVVGGAAGGMVLARRQTATKLAAEGR